MTMTQINEASGSIESHVDRAMRGPTPENPSLSLKKRLKRAAFLDKREREVAQGRAEPVDAAAGLPEAVTAQPFMLRPDSGAQDSSHAA